MKNYILLLFSLLLLLASCNRLVVKEAKIKFKNTELAFGKIKAGDTISQTFNFDNIGNDTLLILQVQPSCECMVADYTTLPVLPGNSGYIKIKYASNKKQDIGKQLKSIVVQSNADTLLTILRIVVIVENDSLSKVIQQSEKI
jgi:hypothetical protein